MMQVYAYRFVRRASILCTLRLKVAELDRMTFASAFDLPKEEYEFK